MKRITFFRKTLALWIVIAAFPFNSVVAADLILTAPPRESAEAGKKIYQPVARYLSKLLKHKVVYEHPGNWLNYQFKMRKDKYDIIFDGPHFVSWRIANIGHEVLIKLPGSLDFMVVADAKNDKLNSGNDMIGKRFCGISPPNLSSLSFLASFRNPVLQAKVKGIKGGMGKVYKAFEKKECPAAVLRNTFYNNKMTQSQRDKVKVIFKSPSMPNQAITVSKRVNQADKVKITNALLTGDGLASIQGVIKRFGGKKVKSFINTDNAEYEGYNRLLEGVIFGW